MAINPRTKLSAAFASGTALFNDMRCNVLTVAPKVYAKQSNMQNGSFSFNGAACHGLINHLALAAEANTVEPGSKTNPLFLSKIYFFRKTDMAFMGAAIYFASTSSGTTAFGGADSVAFNNIIQQVDNISPNNLLPASVWITVTNPQAMRQTAGQQSVNYKGQLGTAGNPNPTLANRQDVNGAIGSLVFTFTEPSANVMKMQIVDSANTSEGSGYYLDSNNSFYRLTQGQLDFRKLLGTAGA